MYMKRLYCIVVFLPVLTMVAPALAQMALPSRPPSSQVTSDCRQHVPNGARINAQTLDITFNGTVVDHLKKCASRGGAQPETGSSGGYYDEFVYSDYYTNPSVNVVDDFGGTFTVPQYPGGSINSSENQDTNPEYWSFWPGVVAYNWPSGGDIVIQPVFEWAQTEEFGPHSYFIFADADWGPPYMQPDSPEIAVSPGDEVESYVWQYESDPDAWQAVAWDLTSGEYTWFEVYNITSAYPKFNAAFLVFEGFDGSGSGGPLPSCTFLPPSSIDYTLVTLDTGVPPTYTPYSGFPFTAEAGPPGTTDFPASSPTCSWSAGYTWSGSNYVMQSGFTP